MSSDNRTGLVVPINIVAFCVGSIDAEEATNGFAGATTVYTDQTATHEAFLGSNVDRSFTEPPWQQLEQGIHLHWALPDTLTQATTNDGNLTFPTVPNRWLLTRFVIQGQTTTQKSWIIESDVLSLDFPSGRRAVTLPTGTGDNQNFCYVGQWQEFDSAWVSSTSNIKDYTQSELTVISSGVASFAAYYPDCRSVFGFCDELTDVPVTGTTSVQLMYVVTGWYDNPVNDPLYRPALLDLSDVQNANGLILSLRAAQDPVSEYLFSQFSATLQQNLQAYDSATTPSVALIQDLVANLNLVLAGVSIYQQQRFAGVTLTPKIQQLIQQNLQGQQLTQLNRALLGAAYPQYLMPLPAGGGVTLPDIQDTFNWTFTGDTTATAAFTVYSGIVQGIEWNPDTQYIYEQPSQLPISASVAIGNNPAEALSAYFNNLNDPKITLFEPLLNAFQMGLLSAFQQPIPNRLEQLYESLREKQFRSVASGTIYTIVKHNSTEITDESNQDELIDLPLPLADNLNLLNIYQQQADQCQAHMSEFRWQLFADWYRIFMADPEIQNLAFIAANYRYTAWNDLINACSKITSNLTTQYAVVQGQLSDELTLKALSAPRFYQPAEPVILLESPDEYDDLRYPARYGGDGRFDANGYLQGRLTDQILTALTVNGTTVTATQFNDVALPTPNNLPYATACDNLLREACLLNTQLIATLTGTSTAVLQTALQELAEGENQSVYQVTEQVPSAVGLNWWSKNPWLPLFAHWTVCFLPLLPTTKNQDVIKYTGEFFTANYSIDPDAGGAIAYKPGNSSYSIPIDPETAAYSQTYTGKAYLLPSPAEHFAIQLKEYLTTNSDTTLQTILSQLESSNILVQPLSGFNSSLLMRQQSLQLCVAVPANTNPANIKYSQLTKLIAPIVEGENNIGPEFNGFYNPIRAGYLQLKLQIVDAFGQKRDVQSNSLICAETMVTYNQQQQPMPLTAYLEPRLSQPSRLLMRWLAADSTGDEEMNAHPATSPICGWLLPNHLDGSFFLYNQQGQPLGSIYLSGDGTQVEWQSAPGNDHTINQSIETVVQYENPQFAKFAIALKNSSPQFFTDFWQSVDTVHGSINPQDLSTNSGISVLIGRPVALVQMLLRLEVAGNPALNQSWSCFTADDYQETENNFTGVNFPVILGDIS